MSTSWRTGVIILAAIIGVGVSVVIFSNMRRDEWNLIKARYEAICAAQSGAIEKELATDMEVLEALRAFHYGSKEVERDEFREFTKTFIDREGLAALEWVERVPASKRAAHESKQQQQGAEDYQIREHGPNGAHVPAGERDEYYPCTFVEPAKQFGDRLGVDHGLDSATMETMNRARDSGDLAVTVLPEREEPEHGAQVLVCAAIYRKNAPTGTEDARREALVGHFVANLRVDKIVAAALAGFPKEDFRATLTERDTTGPPRVIFQTPGASGAGTGIEFKPSVAMADRSFTFQSEATAHYLESRPAIGPFHTFLTLLACTILLVGYLLILTSRTARVERLVEERTATIAEVTRLHSAILDSASYGIASCDPKGRVLTFNPAAERMTGHKAADLIGEPVAILHRADEVEARAKQLSAEINRPVAPGFDVFVARAREGAPEESEWTLVRKDGSEFPARLSVTALHDEFRSI
ncbi:MAG: CHASE domain-containing protein, partial [Planctomycetota bacterium]